MSPHKLRPHRFLPRAFSLVELLVVLALIAILTGIALTASHRAKERADAANCLASLRQLGAAAHLYAADNQLTFPQTSHQRSSGGRSWTASLQPYASGRIAFRCPTDRNLLRPTSYAINDFLTPFPAGAPEIDYSRVPSVATPSATFLFAETTPGFGSSDHFHFSGYAGLPVPPEVFESEVAVEAHGSAANYLFADGHAETLSWSFVKIRLASAFVDPTKGESAP